MQGAAVVMPAAPCLLSLPEIFAEIGAAQPFRGLRKDQFAACKRSQACRPRMRNKIRRAFPARRIKILFCTTTL
jgi:hypothetical protein